jgi:adenylate kinase family enzyme
MKCQYIFLLGRPGCGKSALYRELERQLSERGDGPTLERADDFPKLWARMRRDDALEQQGKERICTRRTASGSYILTDLTILDEILQEVSSDVVAIDKPDHLVFIEFARPRYVEAMQNFHPGILDRCLVIYMDVSFETCWARNVARHAAGDTDGDDHMVGREAMEAVFGHDDQDEFVQHLRDRKIPVVVVDNEADGEEHLQSQVEVLLSELW